MTRSLVPYPGLAATLLLIWLLLTQSFSPGQIALGVLVALVATRAMASLRPRPAVVLQWTPLVRLAVIVAYDIVRSNLAVAAIILNPGDQRKSAFIQLQLELRHEQALAVLALILTATPGTAWVQFDRKTGALLIHVFDLVDEQEWIDLLKTRYETLLRKAFEP